MRFKITVLLFSLALISVTAAAQKNKTKNLVYMDKQGVLRYTSNKTEAAFFGVNYTAPFAHAYRAIKRLNIDPEQAIKNDVYHFSRLGFDAFRVHVWDTEISDTAGNLLDNEHLRLFDFLLAELKKRNIKTIVTPIAFWGNGYPEPDEATPGFSRYYGRGKLTTNDTAIRAQENYMRQFFKHVNPYTKLSYEDDKDIIAVELNNEPSHSNPKSNVTGYINRLAAAVKSTGWSKPVFYNIAQGPYFSDAVAASVVDGFSFQWYPTGLVNNHTMKGNALPNVDAYAIPFRDTVPAFKNKALMVYEFDAADQMGSYLYPAMAKSFRGAGFQWATQFAYDPMHIADVNTEYQTHYLNLAYTPSKAISMFIASEVFHRVPRMKNYGSYPADSLFDVFRLSYAEALSEMNAPDKFYYSNTTQTKPVKPDQLIHIAGVGNSPVVRYGGTGAYFLDKVSANSWRLELMPDAIPVRDPFERPSPQKIVTAIDWVSYDIRINLSALGENFSVIGLNDGNSQATTATNAQFKVSPGTYLLVREGVSKEEALKNVTPGAKEFVAPKPSPKQIVLRHQPATEVSSGRSFSISAIIGGIDTSKVFVQLTRLGGGAFRNISMQKTGYKYSAVVPADLVSPGQLQYRIIIGSGDSTITYPGAIIGNPFKWDQQQSETYKVHVAAIGSAISLYDPAIDRFAHVLPNFRNGFRSTFSSGEITGSMVHKLSITDMRDGEVMGLQTYVGDKLKHREAESDSFTRLVIRVKGDVEKLPLKLSLIDQFGVAYSSTIVVSNKFQDIEVPLSGLVKDSSLLMPRPYPGFQPLYFKSSIDQASFSIASIEHLELRVVSTSSSPIKTLSLEVERVSLR